MFEKKDDAEESIVEKTEIKEKVKFKRAKSEIILKNKLNQKVVLNFPRGRTVIFSPLGKAGLTEDEISSKYYENRKHYFIEEAK